MQGSLEKIQKLMKVGKTLSKLIKIFSIIGSIGCLIGLACIYLVDLTSVQVNGLTLSELIEKTGNLNIASLYCSITIGFIACLSEIILATKAQKYFENELVEETPFTLRGASELKNLGIWTIAVPIVTVVLNSIVYTAFSSIFKNVVDIELSNSTSVGMGIAMLLFSLVFKCVAERDNY